MKTNTGGPAFPTGTGGNTPYSNGMDMRDFFAAQIVQGMIASGNLVRTIKDSELAESAYLIADAMLKARGNT